MKREISQGSEKYTLAYQRKRVWYSVLSCLSAVVVFCTTYAMILPAITMGETVLDGDKAYISNAYIKANEKGVPAISTGTAPFDGADSVTEADTTVNLLDLYLSGCAEGTIFSSDSTANLPAGISFGTNNDYNGTISVVEEEGKKALKLAFDKPLVTNPTDTSLRDLGSIDNYELKFKIPEKYRQYLISVEFSASKNTKDWNEGAQWITDKPYYRFGFTDGTNYALHNDRPWPFAERFNNEDTGTINLGVTDAKKGTSTEYLNPITPEQFNQLSNWTYEDKAGITDVVMAVTVPNDSATVTNGYVLIKEININVAVVTKEISLLDLYLSGCADGKTFSKNNTANLPAGISFGAYNDYDGTISVETVNGKKALKLAFDKRLETEPSGARDISDIENYELKFKIPEEYRQYLTNVKFVASKNTMNWGEGINWGTDKPYYRFGFTNGTDYAIEHDHTWPFADEFNNGYTNSITLGITETKKGDSSVYSAGYTGSNFNALPNWTDDDKANITDVIMAVTVPCKETTDKYVRLEDIIITLEVPTYMFAKGNDSSENNSIVRTFDTVTYTLAFQTALQDGVTTGFSKGRVYFEFILPVDSEKAQFETESMGWLETSPEIAKEVTTVDGKQVLRGSFMLVPNATNDYAIGASLNELAVVVRALRMKNGDTLQPSFTFWLEYNEVGTTYIGNIPQTIVTGNNSVCSKHNKQEYATVTAPKVTVSAAPRYNIEVTNEDNYSTSVGTYDFTSTNTNAPNKDKGSVYGRLRGYGIIIEMRGKNGRGLMGVELPDEGETIKFDLDISSYYFTTIAEGTVVSFDDANKEYRPLLWDGRGNNAGDWNYGRGTPGTYYGCIMSIPSNGGNAYNACEQGGKWSFEQDSVNPYKIHVTVSGYTVGNSFPSSAVWNPSDYPLYYNPATTKNYWETDRAIFSSGEIRMVQPYYSLSDKSFIADRISESGSGQFNTTITDEGLKINAADIAQVNTSDDIKNESITLVESGQLSINLSYLKGNTEGWTDLLTGRLDEDKDWAVAGKDVTLSSWFWYDYAEADNQAVAVDQMIKLDDEFFEPNGSYKINGEVYFDGSNNPNGVNVLWGAKSDGTGWSDDGEMRQTTEDDLVFYTSLAELKAAHKVPVAVLAEYRGLTVSAINHLHFFIYGKVKTEGTVNNSYMMTQTGYVWLKKDVARLVAMDKLKKAAEDVTQEDINALTDNDYRSYCQTNFPSKETGDDFLDDSHNFTAGYPEPTYRCDYYGTDAFSEALRNAVKATYNENGHIPGQWPGIAQDTCLVVPFETTVTKTTAQSGNNGAKKIYDMTLSQRTVDYLLTPKIDRLLGEGTSGASELTTTLYVQDTLPQGLTYIQGSSYLGGNYAQDPDCQKPGTVTGGTSLEPTITTDENGNTVLTWEFGITIDTNDPTWTSPIYFSCTIGTLGNEETDVKNQQQLNNNVIIWSSSEQKHPFTTENGNLAEYGIEILKTSALSLSKTADYSVVDINDVIGFSMNIGNNSSTQKNDTVIVETLPYNGVNGTSFNGNLVVTEFSAGTTDSAANSNSLLNNFTFYYTTKETYKDYTSAKFGSSYDFTTNPDWTKLTLSETANTVQGRPYGVFVNFPDEAGQTNQITAIVAVGNLPAGKTLKMHITVELRGGKPKDCLVNYLSQDNLSCYARTQVVSRSLEGLAWKDTNANGIQDEGEERISGVKVSLYKLEGNSYVQYKNNGNPVSVETGKSVSVQDGISTDYEQGRYKFTDLPAGTFAVRFEDGDTQPISGFIASPYKIDVDDMINSDGIALYSDDRSRLEYTRIEGIVMKPATELTYGTDESKYHDSGFYDRGYELPKSGGSGTAVYTAGGFLMFIFAAFILLNKYFRRVKRGI